MCYRLILRMQKYHFGYVFMMNNECFLIIIYCLFAQEIYHGTFPKKAYQVENTGDLTVSVILILILLRML